MDKEHRRLLMVEDNESYFIALKDALKRCGIPLKVDHIEDGDALMPYLKQGGKPDLILMDINMDRVSGLEALRHVKRDANFKSIPVVMLTTSGRQQDVKEAYENHANAYIRKPYDEQGFDRLVIAIYDFWFSLTLLPA